jgi:4'-phosphopantetheinyl transferase
MDSFSRCEWIDYEGEDLEIPVSGVDLWLIEPSPVYVRCLDSAELLRYERILNPAVRASYSCAQGGLRRIAGMYMHQRPEALAIQRKARGKPYIEGAPEFNLSHTCGRTIAAFATDPVGIDVESTGRAVRAGDLATRFFFEDEAEAIMSQDEAATKLTFLRYWVCKEAVVKLSGDGIYHGLRYARVDLAADGRSCGTYQGRKVALREFRPAADLVAALASWEPVEANGFFRI